MESKKEQLITEVVYQGNHTYEIKKTIDGFKGDKAILIGLYPTVDGDNITKIDSTQLHLINHMKELGLNEVRIMNLYSEVFDRKPTTSQLTYDKENFEYITQAVNTLGEYKLIIAYGSSHSSNKTTNTLKKNLLEAISNSKAKDRVYQTFMNTLNIEYRSLHVLRHTFGSILASEGINVKDLQYMLGHASVVTSMDIYVGSYSENRKKMTENLQKSLFVS